MVVDHSGLAEIPAPDKDSGSEITNERFADDLNKLMKPLPVSPSGAGMSGSPGCDDSYCSSLLASRSFVKSIDQTRKFANTNQSI